MNSRITLYTGPNCHLCEEAKAVIGSPNIPPLEINIVNIASDTALFQRFRYAIPVLEMQEDGRQLGWPFDSTKLIEFLKH